jgi:hypothetical protein
MDFIEFVAVIRRHRALVGVGAAVAIVAAVLSSYTLDGSRLVSRSRPTYESTAVVAIKPGGAIAAPIDEAVPTTLAPAAIPTDSSVTTTSVAPPTTTIAPALDDVIDSRKFYYAALSIQSAIVAPGFVQTLREESPTTDGSISAVVPLDTNTIRIVVSATTPTRATDTLNAALAKLRPLVNSYATSGAFRFTLDTEVISSPSTPTAVSSIKGPLTTVIVFGIVIVLLWLSLRAFDLLQRHQRDSTRPDGFQDTPTETIHLYIDEGSWTESSPPGAERRGAVARVEPQIAGPRGAGDRVEPQVAGPRRAADRIEPRATDRGGNVDRVEPRVAGPRRGLDRVQPRVARPQGPADRVDPPVSRTSRTGGPSRPVIGSPAENRRPESNGVHLPPASPIDSSQLESHVEEDPPKAAPR